MEEKSIVEYNARDGSRIKLTPAIIKKYLVSGRSEFVTDQELFIYMGLCKSRGLNPFIKDCHLVKYSPQEAAAIITSIDYYRKRARAQKDCKGWKTGIIVIDAVGKLTYREGCIVLDGEKLIGGWSEGTPEGWEHPMRKEVNLKRYIKKTKDGNITRFWSEENQPEMIAKVAESQLLRALWPDEFQGLYVDSEVQSEAAQATLNTAVSTPSEPDQAPGPSFDEVFKDEIKDPLFPAYIKSACEQSGHDAEDVKAAMLNQVAHVKAGFQDFKSRAAKTAQPAAPAAAPQPSPTPAPAAITPPPAAETPGKVKTFRDEWINLKPAGYGKFVQAHLDQFKALIPHEKGEAITKWTKFYPGYTCPIAPQETPKAEQQTIGDPQGEAKAPEAGKAPDHFTETSEREAIIKELNTIKRENEYYIMQARKNRGYESTGPYPMSLDALIALRDEVMRLLKERPPKNGN